ncbi:MAG: hypothetical protein U5K51_06605 [Flavobacteriaceae bacterium]|nr:hypothetical protein [Flavobacteriaceae bacterium]
MKKNNFYFVVTLLTAMFFGQTIMAQTNKEDIEMIQSIFGKEKKEMVTDFLQLDSNNPFWALYDEYETKRKELGKDRLQALSFYVDNYEKMDATNSDSTIEKMRKLRDGNDKLLDTYYKKIKKASGSKVAAQFFQLEAYIQSAVRVAVMDEIPFIGELDLQ